MTGSSQSNTAVRWNGAASNQAPDERTPSDRWLLATIEELKPGEADEATRWLHRYEALYALVYGDAVRVPWHRAGPSRSMVEWLNEHGSCHVRPGASAVVVGCGLGDDVVELAGRGFEASGFDGSSSAVAWAHSRNPTHIERIVQADLFTSPIARRADLVVEIDTLSALPRALWPAAVERICEWSRPRGTVLLIERAKQPESSLEMPPFGMDADELRGLMEARGWSATGAIESLACDCAAAEGGTHEWRAAFRRS